MIDTTPRICVRRDPRPSSVERKSYPSEVGMWMWIFVIFAVVCLAAAGWEWVERAHEEVTALFVGLGVASFVSLVLGRRLVWRCLVGLVRFFRRSVRRLEEESRP